MTFVVSESAAGVVSDLNSGGKVVASGVVLETGLCGAIVASSVVSDSRPGGAIVTFSVVSIFGPGVVFISGSCDAVMDSCVISDSDSGCVVMASGVISETGADDAVVASSVVLDSVPGGKRRGSVLSGIIPASGLGGTVVVSLVSDFSSDGVFETSGVISGHGSGCVVKVLFVAPDSGPGVVSISLSDSGPSSAFGSVVVDWRVVSDSGAAGAVNLVCGLGVALTCVSQLHGLTSMIFLIRSTLGKFKLMTPKQPRFNSLIVFFSNKI